MYLVSIVLCMYLVLHLLVYCLKMCFSMLDYALCRKNCRFSIGGESLCVAQNNYAVIWFKGKELNMVFGLQLSIARVVSIIQPLQELFF